MKKCNWLCDVIYVILITLLSLIIGKFTIGLLCSILLNILNGSIYPALNDEIINVITDNFSFLLIIFIVYIYARNKRKSNLNSLYFINDNWHKGLIGLTVGTIACFFACLIAIISKNLHLTYHSFDIFILLLVLFSAFIQAFAEELLFRGFLIEKLSRQYSISFAIIVSSLLFSILHVFNPGVTILTIINITIIGFAFSYIAVLFDSLYLVIFLHLAWNFTEEIIFGLPNSGITFPASVFSIVNSHDSVFYNKVFGIESTIQTLIIWGLILCIALIRRQRK